MKPATPSPARDLLADWIAEEDDVRAQLQRAGAQTGVADPQVVRTLDGLTLLGRMLAGELPFAAVAEAADFLLIEVARGRAVFQGTPTARFHNPMGTVHGGWYATLLDSALGCAVHTTLPAGQAYTTAELSVNYVRALTPQVQRVRAVGHVLHEGRQIRTARAELLGPDGRLYAHASTTCVVFDIPG